MKVFLLLLSLFVASPALAGDWPTKKLSPGGYISYSWGNTNDDSVAPHLDVRQCASLSIGYEDDVAGAGTGGAVSVETCPSSSANVALCAQIANLTADDPGQTYTARPGFLYLDVTASGGAAAISRLNVFCSRQVAP
jgi:hypothetical protein